MDDINFYQAVVEPDFSTLPVSEIHHTTIIEHHHHYIWLATVLTLVFFLNLVAWLIHWVG